MNSEDDDADVIVVGCGPVGETREAVLDDDVIAHSVDSGLLIQAIAHDGDAALEAGYGQRPFPKMTGAMFVGSHDSIGTVQPEPLTNTEPPGQGWRLLRFGASDHVPEFWGELEATVTDVPDEAFPGIADTGATMIVRPDRHIAAVTTDLVEATQQVASILQPSELPVRQ